MGIRIHKFRSLVVVALALSAWVLSGAPAALAAPIEEKNPIWAGYVLERDGSREPFTRVGSSFTVPALRCTRVDTMAVFWIGLDGYYRDSLLQIGLGAECSGGKPKYYLWWEDLPATAHTIPVYYDGTTEPYTIKAGDIVSFSICGLRLDDWACSTRPNTTGRYRLMAAVTPPGNQDQYRPVSVFQHDVTYNTPGTHAECIVERPVGKSKPNGTNKRPQLAQFEPTKMGCSAMSSGELFSVDLQSPQSGYKSRQLDMWRERKLDIGPIHKQWYVNELVDTSAPQSLNGVPGFFTVTWKASR